MSKSGFKLVPRNMVQGMAAPMADVTPSSNDESLVRVKSGTTTKHPPQVTPVELHRFSGEKFSAQQLLEASFRFLLARGPTKSPPFLQGIGNCWIFPLIRKGASSLLGEWVTIPVARVPRKMKNGHRFLP
jgi:hypothetical protein